MTIKPIKNTLLVKLAPKTDTTSSGIILQRETREQWVEILDMGSTASKEFYNVGSKVMIEHGQFKLVKHESLKDGDYAIVEEQHVIGVYL